MLHISADFVTTVLTAAAPSFIRKTDGIATATFNLSVFSSSIELLSSKLELSITVSVTSHLLLILSSVISYSLLILSIYGAGVERSFASPKRCPLCMRWHCGRPQKQ